MAYPDPHDGIAKIVERMRGDLLGHPRFGEIARNPAAAPDAPAEGFIGIKLLLSMLARKADKPLVVFFDEVDGLSEGTAITFLRELRDGYITRETIPFPSSVAICGMMDIRDMKAKVRPHSDTLGSKSPFNVIAEDFTLRNFTEEEVRELYAQHTAATGQVFEPGALARAWEYTQGQPWLANALARECVEKIHGFRYDDPITADDIATAKETIIRRRDTHVDSLMDRLKEDRVRRVVEPVILGSDIFLSDMDEAGYKLFPHEYRFEEYGVPQARHRIIIVGIRKDIPVDFRPPSPVPYRGLDVSCRTALTKPPIPVDAPNSEMTRQSVRVVERLRYIKPGQNAFNAALPAHLRLNVKGAKISQIYKRLDPTKPAYTVTGSGGGGTHIYHWEEPRALTNRERARLQTFPDDYVFCGSKESVRKQIGMAVPCRGARIIFEAILKAFADIPYDSVPCNVEVPPC